MSNTRCESAGTMCVRASERLDASIRELLPDDFVDAIDFHGHLCPGLTIGYRAATIAMSMLGVEPGIDEELVGIVENDSCGVDAFQTITGCTLGKGNLIYKDYGKQAYTLVRRSDGRGVRIILSPSASERDEETAELRKRVMTGQGTADETVEFTKRRTAQALHLLKLPQEQFGTFTKAEIEIPCKARIFDSVICAMCGESVMEPRSRVREGQPCCISCATKYGRGWEINE